MNISHWVTVAYKNSKDHGWWDGVEPGDPRVIPEKLCLIHSEVSEALERYREMPHAVTESEYIVKGDATTKPIGFDSELADIIIRVCDLAGHLGIDLGRAVEEKHAFNRTRPFRHGGKSC